MFLRSNRLNQDFALAQGSNFIGRLDECQIVLDSSSVSKRHLELRPATRRCWFAI